MAGNNPTNVVVGITAAQWDTAMANLNACITRSVVSLTSAATLAAAPSTDYVVFCGSGAAPTMPSAVGNTNLYKLKNVTASAITVSTSSSQTIDGNATLVLPPGQPEALLSDGSNWNTITSKTSWSYTFSGTTKPAGMVDAGQTGTSYVSNGILYDGTIPGSPTNGQAYRGVALYGQAVRTNFYTASVTLANGQGYYEPIGVSVGFDGAGNTGLLFMMCAQSGFEPTCQMVTKVGSTFNVVYSDTSHSVYGLTSPVLSVATSFNGSAWVYTPSLNGTAITAAVWTDTTNVLGAPGPRSGAAFQPIFNYGSQGKTSGVTTMTAADT